MLGVKNKKRLHFAEFITIHKFNMQPEKSKIKPYFNTLQTDLEDHRDPRGKLHNLAFILCGVVIAVLHGRKSPTSIQRFMSNRHSELIEWTGFQSKSAISITQLGRVVRELDWSTYNCINAQYFGVEITEKEESEWIAVDGKELKGSIKVKSSDGKKEKRGEVIVNAVRHGDKRSVGSIYYHGKKESEKTYARKLLEEKDLGVEKLTMDALHCDPATTSFVENNGGVYLIQVKGNQKVLLNQVKTSIEKTPCLYDETTLDKAHGRIEQRRNQIYSIAHLEFADRWTSSSIKTLVVTNRFVIDVKTEKEYTEVSYRISNQPVRKEEFEIMDDLAKAVRGHWSVEADNYVRDVTLKEDAIKTTKGNNCRTWASFRTVGLNIIRRFMPKNIPAKIESWVDNTKNFLLYLKKIGFF